MTMRELAKLAGVSISTVSKAFRDEEEISKETKNLIFDIAKKYGCYGKFYKGKYPKKIIAIICPEFAGGYYSDFVERLQRILEENNCITLISVDRFNDNTQAELVEYFASYLKVDGMFVFGMKDKLKKGFNVPIVSLFSSNDSSVDEITVDLKTPIIETVEYLWELGHRKIAFFGEKLTISKAVNFEEAMKKMPDSESFIIESQYRFEKAGKDAAEQLLALSPDCTAIICAYDNIAFGAIKFLKSKGFRIPDDYSIAGINNIDFSEYTEVPLSSIDSQPDEVCQKAWMLMQNKLKNVYYRNYEPIVVHGQLVIKDTVSKPRKNLSD